MMYHLALAIALAANSIASPVKVDLAPRDDGSSVPKVYWPEGHYYLYTKVIKGDKKLDRLFIGGDGESVIWMDVATVLALPRFPPLISMILLPCVPNASFFQHPLPGTSEAKFVYLSS